LLRVRVAWIDAPESSQAFGQRAKQAMSALVFGKDVELRFHTVDRYGRLVCMVFVDGTDAGLELVKAGLAWAYSHYLPEASPEIQQSYMTAETVARSARLGLWQDDNPTPPWEYRKARTELPIVGNTYEPICFFQSQIQRGRPVFLTKVIWAVETYHLQGGTNFIDGRLTETL
jgi:nuclease-like protein